jgi:hypothetical protein
MCLSQTLRLRVLRDDREKHEHGSIWLALWAALEGLVSSAGLLYLMGVNWLVTAE